MSVAVCAAAQGVLAAFRCAEASVEAEPPSDLHERESASRRPRGSRAHGTHTVREARTCRVHPVRGRDAPAR